MQCAILTASFNGYHFFQLCLFFFHTKVTVLTSSEREHPEIKTESLKAQYFMKKSKCCALLAIGRITMKSTMKSRYSSIHSFAPTAHSHFLDSASLIAAMISGVAT